MSDDYDPLEEFIDAVIGLDVFLTLSDECIQCPSCQLGVLIKSSQEADTELVCCGICDRVFRIEEE